MVLDKLDVKVVAQFRIFGLVRVFWYSTLDLRLSISQTGHQQQMMDMITLF